MPDAIGLRTAATAGMIGPVGAMTAPIMCRMVAVALTNAPSASMKRTPSESQARRASSEWDIVRPEWVSLRDGFI
jgi:hypothetical protein